MTGSVSVVAPTGENSSSSSIPDNSCAARVSQQKSDGGSAPENSKGRVTGRVSQQTDVRACECGSEKTAPFCVR